MKHLLLCAVFIATPLMAEEFTTYVTSPTAKFVSDRSYRWQYPAYQCKKHGKLESDVFIVHLDGEAHGKKYCLRCLRELLDKNMDEVKEVKQP